jgi:hypothetical protein
MSQNEAEKLEHLYLTEVEPFYDRHIDKSVFERARERDRHYPKVWLLPLVVALFVWMFVNSLAAIATFYAVLYVAMLVYTATYPMAKNKDRNILGSIFVYIFFVLLAVFTTFLLFPETLHVLSEDIDFGNEMGIIGRILGGFVTILLLRLMYVMGQGDASSEENALTINNAEMRDAIMRLYFSRFYPQAEWHFSERNQNLSLGNVFPEGTCKAEFILTGLPVGTINGLTVSKEVTRRVKDSDGEWKTETETIIYFQGVSVNLPSFSKPIPQTLAIRPHKNEETSYINLFTTKNPNELEDPNFEARYNVVAGNDFEMRKLFTPLIMERLTQMPPSFYGAHFQPPKQVTLFISIPKKIFAVEACGQRKAIQDNLKQSHATLTEIDAVMQTFLQTFL